MGKEPFDARIQVSLMSRRLEQSLSHSMLFHAVSGRREVDSSVLSVQGTPSPTRSLNLVFRV